MITIISYIYKYIILIVVCLSFTTLIAQSSEIQLANEYLQKGEKDKAYQTFKNLAKDQALHSQLYTPYFNLLLDMAKYREATDLSEKLSKSNQTNPTFLLDQGFVLLKQGKLQDAEKKFFEIIRSRSDDQYQVRTIGDYFINRRLPAFTVEVYREGRAKAQIPSLYALELANALRAMGKTRDMVEEYLLYVTQTPSNIGYIKNVLQMFITTDEDHDALQQALLSKIQINPNSDVFADLLIWTYIQKRDFYSAAVQSKAFDRRFSGGNPTKTFELAQIAFNNHDYQTAQSCYRFITSGYPNSDLFSPSSLGYIKSLEEQVIRVVPVNKDSVQLVINSYSGFSSRFPNNNTSYDAAISQARLYAFYLNRLDSASILLNRLILNLRAPSQIKARAKLELGDIYLIRDEYWESALLYAQVEKMQKDSPNGYEAKLRNARLSYFKGDFKLAEEQLDILKQATSREISNDAIDLSLRIKENTITDTLGTALKIYSAAEMLIFQNRIEEAGDVLALITQESRTKYFNKAALFLPKARLAGLQLKEQGDSVMVRVQDQADLKPIQDDVFWLRARLLRKKGEYAAALQMLEKILKQFCADVWCDDAVFMTAEIYERELKNPDKAMEWYKELLTNHPGSVYAAEARKRFRLLRGDFLTPQETLN